jgi:hypothetical protein
MEGEVCDVGFHGGEDVYLYVFVVDYDRSLDIDGCQHSGSTCSTNGFPFN